MSQLEEAIQKIVDERVERAIEAKLPEIIRALGIKPAEESSGELVEAEEVAMLLGHDVSTPKGLSRGRKHVYNLARQNLIPSVRLSPRCIRFDLAKVKQVLNKGGNAEAYRAA